MNHLSHSKAVRRLAVAALATALLALAPAAQAGKGTQYKGKTKEGDKISFRLDGAWLRGISTRMPTSCVSAQGGSPLVQFSSWEPPYDFRVGKTAKVKVKEPWPERHYTISTRKRGRKITGKLKISYSMLANGAWGGWRILTCYGTASFTAKARR